MAKKKKTTTKKTNTPVTPELPVVEQTPAAEVIVNSTKELIDDLSETIVQGIKDAEPAQQEVAGEGPAAAPEQPKAPTRGILMIALGNPQYGRMAANAAASIRYTDGHIPIHLVHNNTSISHLSAKHLGMFTSMSECPDEYITKNGVANYLKAKTHAYQLSPFDETIMMDVDLLIFGGRKMSNLFDELKDVDFTMQNRGYIDLAQQDLNERYCIWCNVSEVKKAYNTTSRFYLLASELVYFKRTEANAKYFALVQEVFNAPKVKAAKFGSDIPDELAFDIASAVLQHYPHRDKQVWVYWFATEKSETHWPAIVAKYWGFSAGGNNYPPNVITRYNSMANSHKIALGLPHYFPLQPKHKWDKQRLAI